MTTVHVDLTSLSQLKGDPLKGDAYIGGTSIEGIITVLDDKGEVKQARFTLSGKITSPDRNRHFRKTFEFS